MALRLEAWRLELILRPLAHRESSPPPRPGSFLHSTLGPALRRVACEASTACAARCAHPTGCAVGRLLEAHPRDLDVPGTGQDDAPVRLVVQAPSAWKDGEPLAARLLLLSPSKRDVELAETALRSGLLVASASRYGVEVAPDGAWELLPPILPMAASGPVGARIRLSGPVKLRARGRFMAELDLGTLLRRAAWRVAKWAYDLERLPWPELWPTMAAEAMQIRVVQDDTEWISGDRWSARQRRRVPVGGLAGDVELANVSPSCLGLLQLAERCGVGGGVSEGLGRIEIVEILRGRGC